MSTTQRSSLLDKVLVPLDGSPLADAIVRQLGRLLRRHETAVRFVTVLSEATVQEARVRGVDPFGTSLKHLEMQAAPLSKASTEATWDVYVGDPGTRIIEDAKLEHATLIALATHGRSGVERWIRGSVAERVLRASHVPVLVSNPRGLLNEIEVRRILVPLDGSSLSEEILPCARELALLYGAEVVLLHASEPHPDDVARPSLSPEELADLFVPARAALAQVPLRTVGVSSRGAPAEAILRAVEAEHADLVALSTHGRTGLSRWAFGSVAEQVVRNCSAPLLVRRNLPESSG